MAKKKTSKLRLARTLVAGAVFALFILLLADPGGVFHKALAFLPKLQFWPAVLASQIGIVLLLLTLSFILGRVYCSVLCPLGILQDIIYRIRICGKKKRRYAQKWSRPHRVLRFCILAAFILAVAAGFGALACIIEPYSIFGRMMSSPIERSLPVAVLSVITLAVIVILVLRHGRLWCNTVCPVGTILSIPSSRSLFAPVIDLDKCVSCGLCSKACRAECIDAENHKVDMSRCVLCLDCLDNCKENAIQFKFRLTKNEKGATDSGRRAFLVSGALVGSSLIAGAKDKETPHRKTALVPPGAGSLKNFGSHCIACQLCVQTCPNKVLHPSLDPDRLMQPEMDFGKGFCRPECTACSEVCPTGAIRKITPEQKSSTSIGYAVFNPETCVVLTDGVSCGNCARHCPSGAIAMITRSNRSDDLRIPSVNTQRCIGCGRCEWVCPSRPISAIHVEGNSVHHTL